MDHQADARLTRLEEKLSLSEDLLDHLNRLVATQQEQIAIMAREIKRLRDALASAQSDGTAGPDHEKPPHY
ncbi:MAG: SlyX family protein [Burkholderiaceae bacterium]